jgi:nucleoside-diphosphate-sugar epimerase
MTHEPDKAAWGKQSVSDRAQIGEVGYRQSEDGEKMKIFLAGGTGAVGRRLIPLLARRGHQVAATTRSVDKGKILQQLGAEPVFLDGLKRDAVRAAVTSFRPDVIVHQMTALASMRSLKNFDQEFALTNRLRTEGTAYLIEAARSAGARKLIVQSYAGWPSIREGSPIKTEEDSLDPNPPQRMRKTLDAIRLLESTVTAASGLTGVVLRYGSFYGPGTSIAPDGEIGLAVRKGKFPIIGDGGGIWSFIHMDDVANATRLAIEGSISGIYNIVDNEPAELNVWLPFLAKALGGKQPSRLPAWIGRIVLGDAGISMMTKIRGASNVKAKQVLNWRPLYPSWREGFIRGFGRELPQLFD